ncbi:two-component system LytT family sensor kinase [Catalinimonas alkaloidigena]|uniref:sensor histidine kinase n=1 Tax=Catalinimonas alkaloidigena TaxID=1075417 RepID=UPI002406CC27|nr:histidine kinase [Catalinimonas alkaloidigena]MDF9798053.1 two-component system LytT family sensor kinase [Catalinimonas alkaloidigena]
MAPFSVHLSFRSPFIQALVWVVMGLFFLLFQPMAWQASLQIILPVEFWIKQAILFCFLVGIFYLNSELLVPKLLFHNKIGLFILMVLAAVFVLMPVMKTIEGWLNLPELMHRAFHPESDEPARKGSLWFDFFLLLLSMFVLGVSTSVKVIQKWQEDVQLRQSLEQQKISSELSFLKAQINPHFFFNTLNNIYALTLSDLTTARQALHNLSRMMRYVLYETRKDVTFLSQEISFLQDYIKLMQLRLTDKVKVTFKYPSSLHDKSIAPMMFLPYVENAFKHGVSTQSSSCIFINIEQEGNCIHLEVKNSIFNNKSMILEESNGIGLANTKRRLDLLYPGRYALQVNENAPKNTFQVELKIQLS